MDYSGESENGGTPRVNKWLGIAGTDWLKSKTPFGYRFPKSLTGSGVQGLSPTDITPKSQGLEKRSHIRQSGTSVDYEGHEFITPIVSTPKYAPKPRSYTDGALRRRHSISDQKDSDSIRDTIENLSEEVDKQKQKIDKLETCLDLHQKLIKDLISLEDKVQHQNQLLSQVLSEKDTSRKGSVCLGVFPRLLKCILTTRPVQYTLSLLDKEHMKLWLNKCLRLFVSILIYILFKSWLQVCGLGHIAYRIELFVYGVIKMVMLPFTSRTGKSSFLERDKRLH